MCNSRSVRDGSYVIERKITVFTYLIEGKTMGGRKKDGLYVDDIVR